MENIPNYSFFNRYYKYNFSQREVDFLIPNLISDHPFCIDPFLLYKGSKPEYQALHKEILELFTIIISYFKKDDSTKAFSLMNFKEPNEVALGYTNGLPKGRGCATILQREMHRLYLSHPRILDEGITHIEEMQLYCPNIAEDRIGDITTNIIKRYLVEFTRDRCATFGIKTKRQVIYNIYDAKSHLWIPNEFISLPENPYTGKALLFVPLDLLRYLPWINFNGYLEYYKKYILPSAQNKLKKSLVLQYNMNNSEKVKKYIKYKEYTKYQCRPIDILPAYSKSVVQSWIKELDAIQPGRQDAKTFENYTFKILQYLLYPFLTDAEEQVREVDGVHIRDIIFYNSDNKWFWSDIKAKHSSLQIVVELKNTDSPEPKHLDQLNRYLADHFGNFGIIICRSGINEKILRNAIGLYTGHRKVIIFLDDKDVKTMIDYKVRGSNPNFVIRKKYIDFIRKLQS